MLALVAGPRFLRGTSTACGAGETTVAYGRALPGKKRPTRAVPDDSVWDWVPTPRAKVGAVGACDWGNDFWIPCRVVTAEAQGYRVESHEGQRREVGPPKFLGVRGKALETVASHLDARAQVREFDAAASQATVARERALQPGDTVVAPRVGLSFFDGSVVSIAGDHVVVSWTDPAWPHRNVPAPHVGRMVKAPLLYRGQFILWREGKGAWQVGRVVATDPLRLVDRNAKEHQPTAPDLVPFVHRASP